MLPSIHPHGLIEAVVLNACDHLGTPAQSAKFAPRIDAGIDRALVVHLAAFDPRHKQGVEGGPVRCEASRSASPRRELLLGSLSQNRHAAVDLKEDHPLITRQPNVGGTHLDPPATVEISNLSRGVRNIGTKSHANDRARTENGRCGLLSTSTS